ncbi:MAG: thymidine phosphorylase, partial [Lachnospiraceae bacterium]|nr:thymidine phosphorylase [Lachnospiraceae bacterium]
VPLGFQIGNSLEIEEAVQTLHGEGPEDLTEVCLALASELLRLAGKGDLDFCRQLAREAMDSGAALEKLCAMFEAQGGDPAYVREPQKLGRAPYEIEVKASESGYIAQMNAEDVGLAASLLGAGRETKESIIDPLAGIILCRKTGDAVRQGETIARLLTSEEMKLESAQKKLQEAIVIQQDPPARRPLIYARVTEQGVEYR